MGGSVWISGSGRCVSRYTCAIRQRVRHRCPLYRGQRTVRSSHLLVRPIGMDVQTPAILWKEEPPVNQRPLAARVVQLSPAILAATPAPRSFSSQRESRALLMMNRASLRAERPAFGVPVCMTVLAQDVGSGFPLRRERRRVGGTYDVWVGVVGHPQWSGFPLRREWRGNLLTIDRPPAGRPRQFPAIGLDGSRLETPISNGNESWSTSPGYTLVRRR